MNKFDPMTTFDSMQIANWQYSPDILAARLDNLNSAPDFEVIAEKILLEMEIICAIIEPIKYHPVEGYRIAFSLEVSQPLFDLFYNSINGYRAWYFRSPEAGLMKNKYLIERLIPKLTQQNIPGELSKPDIIKSLMLPSAKAWLAEYKNPMCPRCPGEFEYPIDRLSEIKNGRWETSIENIALLGVKAPLLRRIRIYGGFIDSKGNEFIAPDKRHRAEQIHKYGYS